MLEKGKFSNSDRSHNCVQKPHVTKNGTTIFNELDFNAIELGTYELRTPITVYT